jgi:hypothetical protein
MRASSKPHAGARKSSRSSRHGPGPHVELLSLLRQTYTPLGWGSPLRAWLLNRSFHFTSEGVDRSATNKVSAPHARLLQGGLGSHLRAMLLLSFLQARGSPSPKQLVRCYQWPAPPLPAQSRQPSARGSPSPEKNHNKV